MEAAIEAGGVIVVQSVATAQNVSEMELLHWLFDNYLLSAKIERRKPGFKPFVPSSSAELAECKTSLERERQAHLTDVERAAQACFASQQAEVAALREEIARLKGQSAVPPPPPGTLPALAKTSETNRTGLLDQIQRGKPLKKTASAPAPAPVAPSSSFNEALLKRGASLRPKEENDNQDWDE